MASDFNALLRQRIAEHAERDFERMVQAAKTATKKKPLSNTQRHNRWLENFAHKHGMSYFEYNKQVKMGLLPPLGNAKKSSGISTEETTPETSTSVPEESKPATATLE